MADKRTMKAKILVVADEPETWDGKDGYKGASAKCVLDTGEQAVVSSTPQYVQGHIDALKKLVGQEVELEVEDKGQYGYKITAYPGKPTGGGGGRGSGVNPIVFQSQNALLAAAYTCGPGVDPSEVLEIAETVFIPWLKLQAGEATKPSGGSSSPSPEPDKSDGAMQKPTASLAQIRAIRSVIEGLGWDEAYACQEAGVERLGEIAAADVGPLIAEWSGREA